MDRFSELEAFVQIARANSISAAAERMNLAKSAVSRRLSELEERLGVQLFNRTTRQMTLTDAGAVFLRRATALLDDLSEAEEIAGACQTHLVGRLKIAAPLSFGLIYLQPLLSEFASNHPGVELEVDFSDRRVDLVKEGFDLTIRIGVLADSTLIARKICPIRNIVVAAPQFWRQHGVPNKPQDLSQLPCLRYTGLHRPEIIPYWGPKGEKGDVSAAIKMYANNGEFLTNMAVDGHGYIVEPSFFVVEHIEKRMLQPVLCDYVWSNANMHVLYPPTRQLSKRVRSFADVLAAKFENNPYWDERIRAVHAGTRN